MAPGGGTRAVAVATQPSVAQDAHANGTAAGSVSAAAESKGDGGGSATATAFTATATPLSATDAHQPVLNITTFKELAFAAEPSGNYGSGVGGSGSGGEASGGGSLVPARGGDAGGGGDETEQGSQAKLGTWVPGPITGANGGSGSGNSSNGVSGNTTSDNGGSDGTAASDGATPPPGKIALVDKLNGSSDGHGGVSGGGEGRGGGGGGDTATGGGGGGDAGGGSALGGDVTAIGNGVGVGVGVGAGAGVGVRRVWVDIPHVRQSASWDCGIACVQMVLGYLGR